jgi:Zn-dependent peptidase ImmA (M78 family)
MTLREQAARIVESIDPDTRAHLARDPLAAMTNAGLRIGEIDLGESPRRFCDGLSTTTGIVLYMASPGSRRENFTLLHEYVHTLVDADIQAMSWLADQPDINQATKQLCNEVASRLLVPAPVIDAIVGDGPIRAEHLLQLHRQTEGSQVAIAIALARRLNTDGAVMLIDRMSHRVVNAILVGELAIYPANGQPVPTASPLFRIEPGDRIHQRSWWETPWGERQDFYLDATASARRAYAVISTTDIWHMEKFHGGDVTPQRQQRTAVVRSCACGYRGPMSGFPCPTCDKPFCPNCKKCLCDYRNAVAVRCTRCTLSYAPTALVNGLCSDCR